MSIKSIISSLTLAFIFCFCLASNALASAWMSCGCSDKGGPYHRSCYSTTSCDVCCCYSNDDPGCKESKMVEGSREDHEGKSITMIDDGPHVHK